MEWLKELLKKLGIRDEKLDKIEDEIAKELPKHFVPKSRYEEVVEARKNAEKEVTDRDKQLEDLKKSAGDNATLKEQIENLQKENKAAKEKYEADLKEMQLSTAVKLALAGKVHDPDIVASLLDKSKIEIDENGTIKTGLDDQIKALRESKAFLFVQENNGGSQFQFRGAKPPESGSGSGSGGSNDKATDFGKRVAEFAKQNSSTAEAQKSYFGE